MHIAQTAPLYEAVPPPSYGGTERIVWYLTLATTVQTCPVACENVTLRPSRTGIPRSLSRVADSKPITGATAQGFVVTERRVPLHASPAWLCDLHVAPPIRPVSNLRGVVMNNIVWLVGAVVIVLFVLGYFGLR